jgi:hypothetical protein
MNKPTEAQKLDSDMEALIAKTEAQVKVLLDKAVGTSKLHDAMRHGAYALQDRAERYRRQLDDFKSAQKGGAA